MMVEPDDGNLHFLDGLKKFRVNYRHVQHKNLVRLVLLHHIEEILVQTRALDRDSLAFLLISVEEQEGA